MGQDDLQVAFLGEEMLLQMISELLFAQVHLPLRPMKHACQSVKSPKCFGFRMLN